MPTISYHRPASIAEAARLAAADPDARVLAGGQSVLPAMKLGLLTTSAFIDLAGLPELRAIRVAGGNVNIGAMVTHATVAESREIRSAVPALSALAEGIGDAQIRNRGTIGGSIANSDPAADYPAAVLALNATIRTNQRTIAADAFFKGLFETDLKPGELITAIELPIPTRAAYVKFLQPASRFALVGVFVAQTGGQVRVAVTGAAARAFRLEALEEALARRFVPEACGAVTVAAQGLNSDLHGSAEYRASLIPVLARRAVQSAIG
jgi:aerobic carbon-monoxide dehydrogenase medium subunit